MVEEVRKELEAAIQACTAEEIAELEERARKRKREIREAELLTHQGRMDAVMAGPPGCAVVAAFAPEHETNACSDTQRNGNYNDNGIPRCLRCFLLDALERGWPLGATAQLKVTLE